MATIRATAITLVGALALLLAACTGSSTVPKDDPAVAVPKDDLKALADGNNAFALDLYKKVAEKNDGNLILSPYSISLAAAMTYAGARGETAAQMAKALHFTLPPDRLHPAFKGVTEHLQSGRDPSNRLTIANALWGQRDYPFAAPFLDLTRQNYAGGFREMDFVGDAEGSRKAINQWVEEQTEQKIKDLLQAGDVDRETRLVLTNAIFFRGTWKQPFNKSATAKADFETAPGVKVTVDMMSDTRMAVRVSSNSEFQLLELAYASGRNAMVILLPVKRCGLREVEGGLTAAKLSEAMNQMRQAKVDVSLPRWKFTSRFELKKPLQELGMPLPFTKHADFTGMGSGEPLHIKDVIHSGSVEADEEGTVAAAATAVIMHKVSEPPSFQADHPFLFLIRDTQSETILFLGRVSDPR